MLFRKITLRTFLPGVSYFLFLKIAPLPLIYPRGDGDRFPQKIYIPQRGELRGYYGLCHQGTALVLSHKLITSFVVADVTTALE